MILYLARRLAAFLLTLVAASALVFVALDILPGNAAEVMLGASATPEAVAALSAKLGLDRPPLVRYGHWVAGFLHGDLGQSVSYETPVAQLIAERGLGGKRFAVELNGTIVPRSRHASTVFTTGDRAEIVVAVGGG